MIIIYSLVIMIYMPSNESFFIMMIITKVDHDIFEKLFENFLKIPIVES